MMMQEDIGLMLEALLFVSPRPVSLEDLARVLDRTHNTVRDEMEILIDKWRTRGVRIHKVAGGYQMVSAPEAAGYIEKLYRVPVRAPLTRATLETLAVIAYRQPLTKRQIEKIRGVQADRALSQLLERGLIAEVGKAPGPRRSPQYGTTREFLKHFHLDRIEDLPPIQDFLDERLSAALPPEDPLQIKLPLDEDDDSASEIEPKAETIEPKG